MKRLLALALTILFALPSAILPAKAAEPYYNYSYWAAEELADANSLGLIPESLQGDMKREITRAQFCELIMKFCSIYKNYLDVTPAPAGTFTDTEDSNVLSAYSLNIIKGETSNTFAPDKPITREEMAVMLYRAIYAVNDFYEQMNATIGQKLFSDNEKISSFAVTGVYELKAVGLLKGAENNMLLPGNQITVQEAVMLVRRAFRELHPLKSEVSMNGKTVALYMSSNELTGRFGQPQRIDYLPENNMVLYVYDSDPESFFMAGVCHDKVIYVYTNALNFEFNGKKFGSFVYNTGYWNNAGSSGCCHWFNDPSDNGRLYGMELLGTCGSCNGQNSTRDFSKGALACEREIFDMVNAFRACHNISPVEWDGELASVARAHSNDMGINNYFEHYSLNGDSPFDRIDAAGISYNNASENIAYNNCASIEGYSQELLNEWVISTSGHRENMLNPSWTHLGVGVAVVPDKDLGIGYLHYGTQDFITR